MNEKIRTIAGEDIEKGMGCYIDDNILHKFTTARVVYAHNIFTSFFYYGVICPRDVKKGEFITVEIPR